MPLTHGTSFEPKQSSTKVSIEIGHDAEAKALTDQADQIASAAGLKRVGWMFTDLERDVKDSNRFVIRRSPGTYFLKSNELALAAYLQTEFPNRCDLAASGYAGSKFATVVLSGSEVEGSHNIEPEVYQVRCCCFVYDGVNTKCATVRVKLACVAGCSACARLFLYNFAGFRYSHGVREAEHLRCVWSL